MSEEKKTNEGGSSTATATVDPKSAAKTDAKSKQKPRQLPPYHVILLDDNDHTHEYVMVMLRALFGYAPEMGYQLAQQVDQAGRAIVYTAHKEKAELKRDQIHAYGADPRVATCAGSMTAIIQPAAGD